MASLKALRVDFLKASLIRLSTWIWSQAKTYKPQIGWRHPCLNALCNAGAQVWHAIGFFRIFIVLPVRVGKHDSQHVKLLENLKCFCLNSNKKLSKKVTKKAAKLVPTTLNTRAILPTILLGSEWPPSNIWVFMFFRLCLRSMKSCGWTRISNDLLKSLKKVNVIIPFEQVLTRKGHLILNRLQKHVSLSCQGEKTGKPWIEDAVSQLPR